MNVFIPITQEEIFGVFASLREAFDAMNPQNHGYVADVDYDEYVVGSKDRIRSYTKDMALWWENGERV